jgi:HlyD family secretion protein
MRIPYTSITVPIRIPDIVRRHKWKWIIGATIFVVFVLPAWALTRPKQPDYVTAVVEKKDLQQTVEAVGTVTSEKDLELEFKSPGIVASVSVKEGQKVRAGQHLAGLRAGGLGASIASAQASVQEAEANLQALLEGTRPEDLAVAEASLQNKKAALAAAQDAVASSQKELDALKAEIDITQGSDVSLAPSTINETVTDAQQAISAVQDILRNNDLQDAISRGNPGNYYTVQQQLNNLPTEFTGVLSASSGVHDVQSAIAAYQLLRAALIKSSTVIGLTFSAVSQTQPTSYLSQDSLTTYKTSINTQRSTVQAGVSTIDAAINTLQETPATLATRLTSAQTTLSRAKSDVLTYETAVRIEQAQLDLKKAGARQTDIDAARARVNYAKANLARAAADYGDTQIIAPVDGIITKVAIKAGEASPSGSAITSATPLPAPFRTAQPCTTMLSAQARPLLPLRPPWKCAAWA